MTKKTHLEITDPILREKLIAHLMTFLTERRKLLIDRVISLRTNHICLALEDIYQPHNASATLRTCECLGVLNVHIIENYNRWNVNRDVAKGASKWLNVHHYMLKEGPGTPRGIAALKAAGYRLIATSPHAGAYTPENLSLDQKVAILFGNEDQGLSQEALAACDGRLMIPMFGFTESYNISVAVAIIFSHLVRRLHESPDIPWQLTEEQQRNLLLEWLRRSVKSSAMIETRFLEQEGIISTKKDS